MFFPLVSGCFILLMGWIVHVLQKRYQKVYAGDRGDFQVSSVIDNAISIIVTVENLMYTQIASNTFSPFRCFQQIDGTFTLIPNPSQDCYSGEWFRHFPVIVFGMLQLFLFPLIMILILSRTPSGGQSRKTYERRFGILTGPYKPQFYWWEIVVVLQKTIIVVVIDTSYNLHSSMRVFIIVLVLILMYVAEDRLKPFKKTGLSIAASQM